MTGLRFLASFLGVHASRFTSTTIDAMVSLIRSGVRPEVQA